jgi:two-component system phosphate regulon sensor histidine kinase PhoR
MLNKKLLKVIIIAMMVSLSGLIVLQVYTINNAVKLEEKMFEASVNQAIHQVAEIIEKHEVAVNVRDNFNLSSQGKMFFMGIDSLVRKSTTKKDTTTSGLVFWNEISPGELQAEFRQINKDGAVELIEETRFDSSGEVTFKRIRSASRLSEPNRLQSDFGIHLERNEQVSDPRLERFLKKSGLVSDIFKELFKINVQQNIEERVKPEIIDSLLKEKFHEVGIKTSFEFGIYDLINNKLFIDHESKYANDLMKSQFRVRLFPHDIFVHPDYLLVYFPSQSSYIFSNLIFIFIISSLFLLVVIFSFYYTINTILKQKKVSEIKNDFINNMTHELKTPISTISLACEAMGDPDINRAGRIMDNYIKMIAEENKRLGLLVENVLQTAILDKGDFKLKTEQIDIRLVLEKVMKSLSMHLERKKGKLELQLNTERVMVEADPVHITNVMYNLIDNAIKYSKSEPHIIIAVSETEKGLGIEVADNGIGISKDQQKRIFEKLYRVPTGNVHNVKGFGLGLSYVKAIVDKHFGQIRLESELGKGSRFLITIPYFHRSNVLN